MKKDKKFGIISLTVFVTCVIGLFSVAILIYMKTSSERAVIFDGNKVLYSDVINYKSAIVDEDLYYFKAKLNKKEKFYFNVFSYALENGYDKIEIPSCHFSEKSSINKAILYFICDNPLAEENLKYDITAETSVTNTYVEISIPTFTKERFEKKKEAYRKACSIVDAIPFDVTSESDIANFLYLYLVKNVNYTKDEKYLSTTPEFLYDCFVNGETNCDGFANALGMLYNLVDIQCFDVCTQNHTRNIAKINNKYYNFDATFDSNLLSYGVNISPVFYKVSDKFLSNEEKIISELKDDVPLCTDEINDYKNCDFKDYIIKGNENEIIKKMDYNSKRGKKYTVINYKNDMTDAEIDTFADTVAEIKNSNIYYYLDPKIKTIMISYNY